MKAMTLGFILGLAAIAVEVSAQQQIVCVWPDGSQTMPDYYTNTCPMGSTPMRR